jgi:hypothetical protein
LDLISEIEKKFNEERKARVTIEKDFLDLERTNKMLNSDLKFLKEEIYKLQKNLNLQLDKEKAIKLELEQEIHKRAQIQNEFNEFNQELTNFKIKDKQSMKIIQDLTEEKFNLTDELNKLRKYINDFENYKFKALNEELDELKQMNQLYRSQRMELGEENELLSKDKDKLKQDSLQLQCEK